LIRRKLQPSSGSLTCYTCKTQLSNSNCQTAEQCTNSSQACKTDVISKAKSQFGIRHRRG
uniref:Snake toxin/toxin-like domain-containing protein n=1 Tax=Chelydra serpentina TaxID=8475 RepID=A0A8C3STP8_CHESE